MQADGWMFWVTTLWTVWAIQQTWKLSGRYVFLVRYGVFANKALLFRAWAQREQASRCPFFLWWFLSLVAIGMSYAACAGFDRPVTAGGWLQWLCLLLLPMFFLALARIDGQVLLLPDALLIPLAFLGGLYKLGLGKLPIFTLPVLFSIVLLFFYCFNTWIQKQRAHTVLRWFGAGDFKFLFVAFIWLPAGQIMLMWGYAALFCWIHQSWRQGQLLPRGHAALGPYLVLGWMVAQWVHPAFL